MDSPRALYVPFVNVPFIPLVSQLTSEDKVTTYDNAATSNPRMNQGIRNDHPTLKRITILDEPDDSAMKKHKQSAENLNGSLPETSVLAIKSRAQSSMCRFSTEIVQKDNDEETKISPFDAPSSKLKKYAFVGTLRFPENEVSESLPDYWELCVNSDFGKGLPGSKHSSKLSFLIQEMITFTRNPEFTQNPEEEYLVKAQSLVKEIFLRNSAFIIAFTPPESESGCSNGHCSRATTREVNKLRMEEQSKLLEWLIRMLNNDIQSRAACLPTSAESNDRPHSTSSLHKILSSYFHDDLEDAGNISGWGEISIRVKGRKNVMASAKMAITKKVAINALENYYKSTDPIQWENLIQNGFSFVNFFAMLRKYEQSGKLYLIYRQYFSIGENFGLFPWGEPTAPWKNQPDDKHIKRFLKLIAKFDWSLLMKRYFKKVGDSVQDKPVSLNLAEGQADSELIGR
jgi:hypothetical protein